MIPRESLIATAQRVYRSFGFVPIDTPVLEYLEILTGKGSEETDRQMYSFRDHGDRNVGMRFDLTVPLARFAAKHIGDLGTPFKRYQIGKVWRGERPQAGRYREFMQCDFDTIGTRSILSDVETGLVIHELMSAIGFDAFTIHVNNRKLLTGLLEKIGLEGQSGDVLRVLDKLDKIGPEKVAVEMQAQTGASSPQIETVLKLAQIQGSNDSILEQVSKLVAGNETGEQGVGELRELSAAVAASGVSESNLKINVSIARGLDYYTGTVFETTLDDLPSIGSVCSGGRYDNLASLYTKQELPGIGASLGLDRLLTAMQKLNMIESVRTTADLLILLFDKERTNDYLRIAACLRRRGIGVEVYPELKKMNQQFKYADRRGFKAALIAGANEFAEEKVQIKWMDSGQQVDVPITQTCDRIADVLLESLKRNG